MITAERAARLTTATGTLLTFLSGIGMGSTDQTQECNPYSFKRKS